MSGGASFPPGVAVVRPVPRSPRPRRIDVRISAADGRAPCRGLANAISRG
jgi:hypothetical protein